MGRIGRFYTPAHILHDPHFDAEVADTRSAIVLKQAATYVTEFLTSASPAVGRAGAVCPFAGPALKRNTISLAASELDVADEDALMADVGSLLHRFLAECAESGNPADDTLRAFMVVFPHLPATGAGDLIKSAQKKLKPDFVERGLMIGEFFPNCPAPGLHNADFRPLDTPFYSLAIRNMTLVDAPFMIENDRCVRAYIKRFGHEAVVRLRALLEKGICPHRTQAIAAILSSADAAPVASAA